MAARPGWKDYDGTLYESNDERLIGLGNPPSSPTFGSQYPGQGTMQLTRTVIDDGPEGLVEV